MKTKAAENFNILVTDTPRYFRHFKGNYYKLLHFAYDSETMERMVVYQALYGDCHLWVRPEKMFFEEILRDGKRMRRFEEVSECEVKLSNSL